MSVSGMVTEYKENGTTTTIISDEPVQDTLWLDSGRMTVNLTGILGKVDRIVDAGADFPCRRQGLGQGQRPT